MQDYEYIDCVMERGHINIPLILIENIQSLDISSENLGYLLLAMARSKIISSPEEYAKDYWIKWALAEGWCTWNLEGEAKTISFSPLWRRLYYVLQKIDKAKDECKSVSANEKGKFDYNQILKWLDQARGTLSITLREKQLLQEFNIKYGWSTEFILIFLQLCFERGQTNIQVYKPVAKRVYENGINTVDGLISFIDNLDWIQYKVGEVKKCVGQYGGITRPQREMYMKWCGQWKFGHEVIMKAAEETVRTNSPSFKYIDSILENWYSQGVKNIEDAGKALYEHDNKEEKTQKQGNKKKRISHADSRDWEKMLDVN
ncbi:MAG: DnaD domain protein [Clostridia bacterium]|nr:DnaD domain protein [Clostridia bacterium]MDD4047255.1 DnaD domain protein [Clostridia bacterium]